jgi:hypothetical protein
MGEAAYYFFDHKSAKSTESFSVKQEYDFEKISLFFLPFKKDYIFLCVR